MRALTCQLTLLLGTLGLVALARPAAALVTEPDGTVVPIAAGQSSDLTCCGNTEANMSLPALFNFLHEPIDYRAEAVQDPQYFSPQCSFTGFLILRGGACKTEFGWYNVDPNYPPFPSQPPPEIFPLVKAEDFANLATFYPKVPVTGTCDNPPLCTNNPAWQPVRGSGSLENIRTSPNYRGGYVGFAMKADTAGSCPQSKYSEPRYNQSTIWGGNWISLVMWKSKILPGTYYVGVEDLPMADNNFAGIENQPFMNDGDFNDFVYVVQGISCPDAGKPCSLQKEGACGLGLTECDATGKATTCVPLFNQTAEICDNIDNDCNGLVDDKAPCPANQICFRGSCVPTCSGGEFPCGAHEVCDSESGVCVPEDCINTKCGAGQVCVSGQCLGGCEGVTCPAGQTCQLGRCYDPCAGRTCAAGKVCEGGACVDNCGCRSCPSGKVCAADGRCVPQGCTDASRAPISCGPSATCATDGSGQCVPICQGVICPGGADCDPSNGQCGKPKAGWTPGTATGGSGNPFANMNGGSGGAADEGLLIPPAASPACGCRTAGSARGGLTALWLLGLALADARRRRRSRPNCAHQAKRTA